MRSLQEWEETLRRQVAGGNLLLGQLPLGEPPYNNSHMDELGRLLALRFTRNESVYQNATKVEDTTPLSFALFLVLHGIYNYEQGEYWPEPCHQLGIAYEGNHTALLGRAFRRILAKFQLPTFAHIQGQQNLVPILAHGGIPNYSLGDFFRLLHKSIRGSTIQVDAETLIEEWEQDPEHAFLWIDRPVERFVLHGGAIATDFVEECITLVTARPQEPTTQLALPRRVIDAYEAWRDQSGDEHLSVPQIRLRRPVLYIDPYGQGVAIELPAPFYPLGQGVESLHWEITSGSRSFEVLTDRQRVAEGYEYHATQEVHPPVAPFYQVTLRAQQEIVRTWTVTSFGDDPLLLFDRDTWALLSKDEYNHPGERWVLYLQNAVLQVEGGQLTGQLPTQYGEWSQYCVEEWIVPAASTLTLRQPGGKVFQLAIADELNLRRPHLVGGQKPLAHNVNPRFPLYCGAPPGLRIAFVQKPGPAQLARWQISVRPEGKARPEKPISYRLDHLTQHLAFEDDGSVVLDLGAAELLGSRPIGKFEIQARGPFGQSRRLGLRIVPHLSVSGGKKLYLDQVDAEAIVRIVCDSGSRLELLSTEREATCTAERVAPSYYEVCAPAHIHTLKFALHSHDGVTVPFSLQLRRLRWALVEGIDTQDLAWETLPRKIYPDALADVYNAELYVELPPFVDDEKLYGGWRLIDSGDRVWAERPPDGERSRRQYAIHIPELLAEYRQVRAQGEILRLQIWVTRELDDGVTEHFVDALYLLPTYETGEIISEWEETDEGIYLSLLWSELLPGRNRVLYLWSADEPWLEQPRQIPIPDENILGCRLFVPNLYDGSSYRGDYLAAIEVKSPWSSHTPERPDSSQMHVFVLSPPRAVDYYDRLQGSLNDAAATAEEMLILLHRYHRKGSVDDMHAVNRKMWKAAQDGQLQIEQLVLWAELAQELDRTAYKLAQQFGLFSDKTIEELERRDISESWRQRYFVHLPVDLPGKGDIYEYFLVADLPEVRNKCLEALCRMAKTSGIEQLLEDVENGRLLVKQAVEYLLPAADKVTGYLVNRRTADALTLLGLLAERSAGPVLWLQSGYWLQTEIGEGEVEKLVAIATGEAVACCTLTDPVLATVNGNGTTGQVSFLLDLAARTAQIQAAEAYQCSHCRRVFGSHKDVVNHHDESHPYGKLQFRRLGAQSAFVSVGELTVQAKRVEKKGQEREFASH